MFQQKSNQQIPAPIAETTVVKLLPAAETHLATPKSIIPVQRQAYGPQNGLPIPLKSGIENLSGYSMDDVQVHYNSSKPAQLNAHAYAQGSNIFLGPGQEKHLPHEAWHVVQQKQGRVKATRQLKPRITINDDSHLELEADLMGKRALQLKLDNSREIAPQKAHVSKAVIQTKGGNVAGTGVLPRFRRQAEEQATVFERLPPAMDEGRDADGNDAKKVRFENALANWVRQNEEMFLGAVKQLSQRIWAYLGQRVVHIHKTLESSLSDLIPAATTYGRLAVEEHYENQFQGILEGGEGSLHEHLLIHQMFVDKIYNQDAEQIVGDLREQFQALIPDPLPENALKPAGKAIDIGTGSVTYKTGHNDARMEPVRNRPPNVASGGLGPYSPAQHGEGAMIRGTDRFTAVEDNAFIQAARLVLNMPISGTGLSGSATDMFACATLFGMTNKSMYALAAFSFFASAGAHTFHEVMLMAKSAGFSPYIAGNYMSAIPEEIRATIRERLWDEFGALLGAYEAEPEPEQAADGRLHGWKDTLVMDGEIVEWTAQIRGFFVRRFGVAAEAVNVAPIADGRSGDMVYSVDVDKGGDDGIFRGIFKVFNDADLADTEIQIGEMMAARGVNTPGNQGVMRIETSPDSPSKAGVLFNRAEGQSIAEMLRAIRENPAEDEARRGVLLANLERGVIAVANQLAVLHGKRSGGAVGRLPHVPEAMKRQDWMQETIKDLHERGLYQTHLANVSRAKLIEVERQALTHALDRLVELNLKQQKLRTSMTHGDANAGNFIIDGNTAALIDVNTGVQSLGASDNFTKTGAADTGRFLETLRTSSPGALQAAEITHLEERFHYTYMPSISPAQIGEQALGKKERYRQNDIITPEIAADRAAEQYYRACWVLNQLSHVDTPERVRELKTRLIELIPDLEGHLIIE